MPDNIIPSTANFILTTVTRTVNRWFYSYITDKVTVE